MVQVRGGGFRERPRWRNCIARQTSNLKVLGLSPRRGVIFTFFFFIASVYE